MRLVRDTDITRRQAHGGNEEVGNEFQECLVLDQASPASCFGFCRCDGGLRSTREATGGAGEHKARRMRLLRGVEKEDRSGQSQDAHDP